MDENILSRGFILNAIRPETVGVRVKPLNASVRVLSIWKAPLELVRHGHLLTISDGKSSTTSVTLASELNSLVDENLMEVFAVLRINEIVCHSFNNRKAIILLSLEISIPGNFLRVKIGNPISCDVQTLPLPVPEERIDATSLTSGFIARVVREEPLPLNPVVHSRKRWSVVT